MGLSDLGFSRLFSAQLAARWIELFGEDQPITIDDLLSDPDTALYLRTASGADIRPSRHQRSFESRAFKRWLDYFTRHPLPTHDGQNNLILTSDGGYWRLTRVLPRRPERPHIKPSANTLWTGKGKRPT